MAQVTRDFALQMLAHADRGEHAPLTIHEEEQLARAWLKLDELRGILGVNTNQIAAAAYQHGIEQAIKVVETYRVSVGNSAAGEMAAEWTMENLREVRDELREMVPNTGDKPPCEAGSA